VPRHDIEAVIPVHVTRNADLTITVKSDSKTLGTLLVSKGTLDWRGGRRQSTVSIAWEQFARLMDAWAAGEIALPRRGGAGAS
jgi:hypothetical protein